VRRAWWLNLSLGLRPEPEPERGGEADRERKVLMVDTTNGRGGGEDGEGERSVGRMDGCVFRGFLHFFCGFFVPLFFTRLSWSYVICAVWCVPPTARSRSF
jgi:hypothetical protein